MNFYEKKLFIKKDGSCFITFFYNSKNKINFIEKNTIFKKSNNFIIQSSKKKNITNIIKNFIK
jgi:hypothetical protein